MSFANNLLAQTNVNINIAITPPYSTRISDYANNPGKVIVSLTYTAGAVGGDLKVLLKSQITGDNGIVLATKANYRPLSPIVLQPNIPKVIDLQTISELFDMNSFTVQGITTREVLEKGGMPEGNYQFCVRAYLWDSPTVPVSAASPLGCTTVRLTQLEPPILVKPFDKENIIGNNVQNVIFNWNIPAGAEPGTQYVFRIIEMLDATKNANDAMNSKTTPAFFETTTASNILVYGPAQPALVVGRKYAWAVTALPGVRGVAYKNNGRSEVRSFVYAEKVNTPANFIVTTSTPRDRDKLEAGVIGFKWDYSQGKIIKKEELVLVEVRKNQTAANAINENVKIAITDSKSKIAKVDLTNNDGKKFAWQIKITDDNNKVYSSDIQTFETEEKVISMVTHFYPKNGESVPSSSITFHWTYDKSFDKDKQGKDYYPKQLPIIVEVKAGQTAEVAIKNNTNINTSSAQTYNTKSIDLSNYAGKKLAWKVNVTYLDKTYSSNIDTFRVIQFDESLKNAITQFTINGFPITVKTLNNIAGFRYKGTGTTNLYKNGPIVNVSFDDLTILPFGVKFKANTQVPESYTNWAATFATTAVVTSIPKVSNGASNPSIPLKSLQKDIGGNFYFDVSGINFNPFLVAYFDGAKKCFVKLSNNANPTNFDESPTIIGKFHWKSEISNKENGKVKMAEFLSDKDESFTYSYEYKFKPQEKFVPTYINGDVSQNINLNNRVNEELVLSTMLKINKEDFVDCKFSGAYKIKTPTTNKKGIEVWFTDITKLEFDKTLDGDGWLEKLDDVGVVKASFKKVSVCFNSSSSKPFGITIPELKLNLYTENLSKTSLFEYALNNVPFTGANGLKININQTLQKPAKFNYWGFEITSTLLKCITDKTTLTTFSLASSLNIPFVNKKANTNFSVDKNGFVKSPLTYTSSSPLILYQDPSTGDKCTFSLTKAELDKSEIDLNGNFTFSNTIDAEKNINVSNIASPTIKVDFTGDAKMKEMDGEGFANTLNNPTGVFNGFALTPMKLALAKLSGQTKYELKIKGIMALGDNLGTNNTTENFSTKVSFNDPSPSQSGVSVNLKDNFATFVAYHQYQKIAGSQDITFASESKASSDNESSSFTNVGLTFFSGDKDYGTGFKANMSYSLKNPSDPNAPTNGDQTVTAIMWVGHMKESGGYNYWFLEAGQKNFVVIPIPPTDIVINGFKGRIYYHMRHEGDNINDGTTYKPDNSEFIGVYAQVNLKTGLDNGVRFWGDLAMEVLTNNSGLESIKLLGNGNFITGGEGKPGIIEAKDCKLNMYWQPKKLVGDFNVNFGTEQIKMKTHTGLEISGDVFHIWGSGSGSLFGIEVPGGVGFDLDKNRVLVYGEYKLKQIHWHRDGIWSDDDVYIEARAKASASVQYSPFHVRASANLYGSATYVEETLGSLSTNFDLHAQLEFPSPTCVSAGISVFGFDFDAGIKDGTIIWGKCWND